MATIEYCVTVVGNHGGAQMPPWERPTTYKPPTN